MFEFNYDFGDDTHYVPYTLEVDDLDVVEALFDMYDGAKGVLEHIDFDNYIDHNNDIPCTIDDYLDEVWDGTLRGFANRFDIAFIVDELRMELSEYFEKKAANEYKK